MLAHNVLVFVCGVSCAVQNSSSLPGVEGDTRQRDGAVEQDEDCAQDEESDKAPLLPVYVS